MGRTVDFAKRRIAGDAVFWLVIFFVAYFLYQGQQLTQAAWLLLLALAFTVSLAYTRRMKRRQRRARQAKAR